MALAAKNIRMPHDSCTHESLQQVSDLSSGFVFRATTSNNYEPDQVINFKSGYFISNSFIPYNESLLSFEKSNNLNCESNNFVYLKDKNEQEEQQSGGICDNGGNLQLHHGVDYLHRGVSNYPWNHTTTTTNNTTSKEDINGEEGAYGWLYSDEPTHLLALADGFQQPQTQQDPCFHKRGPNMGDNMQPLKKQCTKKAKPKSSSPSKDPQSIAAKNRRERISERLKVLQELVPNGCKVDLVTMLEKAISYVKFLQLQVKVLATDEFWPVQGGKAPDVSQVKEAIDAVLTSQRETSSSSK